MIIVIYPTSALRITLTLIGIGGKLQILLPRHQMTMILTVHKNGAQLLMYIFLNGNQYLAQSISPSLYNITSGMRLIDRSNIHIMMTNFSYILSSLLLCKLSGVVAEK